MANGTIDLSRRRVLQATGTTFGAVPASGIVSAGGNSTDEFNVGYASVSGVAAARRAADTVVREFDAIDVITVELDAELSKQLAARSDVRYVEENGTMVALGQTLPWGIDRVDADVATDNGDTGNGSDVAIIDTGIDSDHLDVEHDLGTGKAFVECGGGTGLMDPCDFEGNVCVMPWDDDHNHGTHCAGIAAAIDDDNGVVGVGPGITLHAVKVLDCYGSGSYSDVAAGIEWTADQGYDVASMSIGGGKSSTVEDAVEYAASQGVTLVAAAGNSGPCTDCVTYPAAEPEVIAVSATNCSDDLADFSSQGPEVELAAPGENVYSTIPGDYKTMSGTSMACPHVSGAAGVLAAQGLSRSEIRSTLKNNAEDVGLSDAESGAGLLDVAAAVGLDSRDDGLGNGPNC